MHHVCAAHGDRPAVGVDIDAQGSSLGQDKTIFPLNARVSRVSRMPRVNIGKNPGWFALALGQALVFLGFLMILKELKM